jgi:hypothetical protein
MTANHGLPPEFFGWISNFTLRVCTPIYWHDRRRPFPKDVQGASCFFLRFDERTVGITADHVVDAYHAARALSPTTVCQLRLAEFDLDAALIDRDQRLDLATFAVSEAQIAAINAAVIDCRGNWPPPKPARMQRASFAGFPEIIRAVHPDRSADFNAYGGLEVVEDVTDREIIFTYDPERVQPLNAPKPPLGFNLSGCSGGPVLIHGTRNGLHRWFPVGLLIGAPKEAGTGELASLDIVRARRIHCLRPDGTLDKASSGGWLPN